MATDSLRIARRPLVGSGRSPRDIARGVTLVELMVAMVIGLIITFAVVQIFSSSRSAYQLDEGLARSQENGRFAVDFMTRDIREAALMGCTRSPRLINNLASNTAAALDFSKPILGFEANGTAPGDAITLGSAPGGWTPALDSSLTSSAAPGSDVIVVRMIASSPLRLRAPYADGDTVYLDPVEATKITKDAIALIGNCDSASIFQVTNDPAADGGDLQHQSAGSPGNACATWGTPPCVDQEYGADAEAFAVQTYAYFIRQGANGNPALWRASYPLSGAGAVALSAQELVSNVENMQILYGVDLDNGERADGDADRYYTAAEVTANNLWDFVVNVRVSLLVASDQSTGTAADTVADTTDYLLGGIDNGTAVTVKPAANNFQKRRVFDTTIQIRNRGV